MADRWRRSASSAASGCGRRMRAVEARLRRGQRAGLGTPRRTIAAGGKRLRPLLVFVAGLDGAGRDAPLVRAAVAVELVHSATLVHDDVLDAAAAAPRTPDGLGRGRAGGGDGDRRPALLARLRRAGGERERRAAPHALGARARRWPEGELVQRADAWNAEVTIERYLRRCELKTAQPVRGGLRARGAAAGGARPTSGRSGGRSGWPSRSSTTCSTSAGRSSATGKAPGDRPARRDGHAAADPRPRARPGLAAARPARAIEDAGAGVRPDRGHGATERRPSRALELVAAAKARAARRASARVSARALELVADGVARAVR